jgi:hypothetical protein
VFRFGVRQNTSFKGAQFHAVPLFGEVNEH